MSLGKLIGSTFGSAYILFKMPGTSTSFIIFVATWYLKGYITNSIIFYLIFLSIILGLLSIGSYKEEDPKEFTLDETFAIFIICLFSLHDVYTHILSFVFFRLFDIFKPFGIKFIENKTKRFRLFSVYFDDFIAALYTIIVVYFFNNILNITIK